MPVRLVVDNTELKKQVLSGEKHMGNFTQVEFEAFNQLVASMTLNEIDAFTTAAVAPVCEVFGYDELNPSWFVHGTKFEHDIWHIKVGQNALTIDFHVPLNDGNLLVSIRHRPLLNTLKHWLVQAGNPYVNGGKLLKPSTTYAQIKARLLLIDGILARADELNLAQRHMLVVNSNFIQDLMAEYVEGTGHKLRRYHETVRGYLIKKIETVSDEAAATFAEQYPYITRNIDVEENELLLTKDQRIRACCFLYSNWAYGNKRRNKKKCSYSTPNSNYFRDILFKHKTLNVNDWRLSRFRSLAITPEEDPAEFFRVPISDYVKDGVGLNSLSRMLTAFRGLAFIDTADASLCPDGAFDGITVKSINEQVIVRNVGRYTTLPTDIVFTAIRNAFEFCYQYADAILDSMHQVLKHVPKNNKNLKDSNRSPLSIYKSGGFLEYVSPELVELGVCQWCIDNRDPDRFELRRQNWGLLDLFNVLSGCIQVIIGATMARRVNELIELPPKECLLPSGVNPNLESSKDVEFELIFDNRKSGVGGEEELRETVSRPILRSVAVFIYKLEEFNKKLFADKLITTKKKTLFTRIDRQCAIALGIQKQGYSRNLDSFCDYFELPTVEYAENDVRRYYIRQHQLRRFFAMVFFWLRGAASLDTLRYFLCHTDSEHLYHYVTEGLQGEVLVGIKARSIREGLTSGHVQNIEKLLPILRRRYGVDYLKLRGFREVLSDYAHYDEDEAQFTPPLERIREQFEQETIDFEADISRLLLEGTIDLQPEFFTVMDADGHVITDYKIILRVTEEV